MLRSFVLIAASIGASATAIAADELPRRKSGLWVMSVTRPGGAVPMTMQQCVDEKTDDIRPWMFKPTKHACKSQMKRDGSRIVFDSTCKLGATTAKTRSVFVGNYSSSYTQESTTTFSPLTAGMKEDVTRQSARWTGRCPAGMTAGDVVMPDGRKFNVHEITRLHANERDAAQQAGPQHR